MIDETLKGQSFEAKDSAFLTELVYGVFRRRGFLDWQIHHFSKTGRMKSQVRNILRLGLYQLLFLDRVPPYAAVNTAVGLAKSCCGRSSGAFVNAVLRNIVRAKGALPTPGQNNPAEFIAVTESHPEWMVRRWLDRFGEAATVSICRANNEQPPMTLRVNVLKTHRDKLYDELTKAGGHLRKTAISPDGLIVKGLSLHSLPAFRSGEIYVQDEGAQLITYLIDPQAGENILDLCAAPGGKMSHLAERSGGKAAIVATDIDERRLSLIRENINRLHSPACRVEKIEDALAPDRFYDRIVVDAPCSALGILRRIPEGKWWKKPDIIAESARKQAALLEKALLHLKPKGRLVYITCSTEAEENEAIAAGFSERHPKMVIEDPAPSLPDPARKYVNAMGYFTTAANSDKMDRFFAVKWMNHRSHP